jgi:thioredoxin reductase (NADPH)
MNTTDVENFPGFREGIMGPALMDEMRAQAERFGAELRDRRRHRVDFSGEFKVVDGTGTSQGVRRDPRDRVGLPQARVPPGGHPVGHGVSACATCDGFFFRDRRSRSWAAATPPWRRRPS